MNLGVSYTIDRFDDGSQRVIVALSPEAVTRIEAAQDREAARVVTWTVTSRLGELLCTPSAER